MSDKEYIKWEKVMFCAEPRYMKDLVKNEYCSSQKTCNNNLFFVSNEKYFPIAAAVLLFDFCPFDDFLSHGRISL